MRSWPPGEPLGNHPKRVSSAVMAGCSPSISSRPTKAATSTFCARNSAPRWPSPRFTDLEREDRPMTKLSPATRDKLKGVSTATLASALYKRGLRNQMIQDVRPLSPPKGGSMVGEAYTLRYMPAREDLNPMTVFRDHSHPQRRAVEECPPGAVLVMDSR